jgi:hypothetical protein
MQRDSNHHRRLIFRALDRGGQMSESGSIIGALANIFRGFSLVFGISAPPPGQNELRFVMLWLGIIAVTIVFFIGVLLAISHFHVA